jgi:hypothetical protein
VQIAADVLEPLPVLIVRREGIDRLRLVVGRDDGESIHRERDIDVVSTASVFVRVGEPRGLTAPPIDDDLETILAAKFGSENRGEVRARKRLAGHDAEASTLNHHQTLNA